MTAAICLKCGTMKVGAFSPCPKCRFAPESAQDQARSILLSDRNLDSTALRETSERISSGDAPKFDEEAVSKMAVEFEELRKHIPRRPLGCLIFQWVLIGIVVALALAIIYLNWYARGKR